MNRGRTTVHSSSKEITFTADKNAEYIQMMMSEQTKKDTASIWLYLVNIYFLLLALRCSTRGFRASGAKLFFFSCCLCSRHSQSRNISILAISQFCRIVNPPFFFRRMCKNRCHRTRRLFPSFAYLGRSINAVGGKKIISSLLK